LPSRSVNARSRPSISTTNRTTPVLSAAGNTADAARIFRPGIAIGLDCSTSSVLAAEADASRAAK
jgi:hypothetical protein